MIKVSVMLDNKEYERKPQGVEIAKILKRLQTTEITLDELANKLSNGYSFRPAILYGTKEKDWNNQIIFCLDFDDGTSIKTELEKCKELNILPAFIYTSFSHTEENNRFRMVFCANELITDYDIAKKVQLTLMQLFPNSDKQCKNLSRIFYGGLSIKYEGYENIIDYKEILSKYPLEVSNVNVKEKTTPNIKISNILYNIRGEKTSKCDEYNIKAIANRDVKYLKGKINNPHIIFKNNKEFFEYIYTYPLDELLEIQYPESFRCIFHDDHNPSASIFISGKDGHYLYTCHGNCNVTYNIVNVIELLGHFPNRPKTLKFIKDIFNIEIEQTEWQKEQKELIEWNRRILIDGEFEKQCPTTYKNIKRNIKYLEQLYYIAEDNIYSDKYTDDQGNIVFFASNSYILQRMCMSKNSSKTISQKNALFVYHYLLNKLSNEDINEDNLKRSQAISANNKDKYRHINYYSIPAFNTESYKDIEKQGQKWKDNNYSMTGCSREMFMRGEGKDVADRIFPQYKQIYDKKKKQIVDRTTTKFSDNLEDIIVLCIFNQIDERGYAIEKDIVMDIISNMDLNINIKHKTVELQIKKSMKEILDGYDLQRIRANKELKTKYGITSKGYPFLILKNK